MKKLCKSAVCTFLVATLLALNTYALPASATESNNVCKGTSISGEKTTTVEEQVNQDLANPKLSQSQKESVRKKLDYYKNVKSGNKTMASKSMLRANSTYNVLAVPYCQQINGNYCGPATVQQSLQYLAGSSPFQSQIGHDLGTDKTNTTSMHKMREYLNTHQHSAVYVLLYTDEDTITQSSMFSLSQHALADCSDPPFLCTAFTKDTRTIPGEFWAYSTNGHYMNISGTDSSSMFYLVTDPNIGRINKDSSGKYWVSSEALFAALRTGFAY